MRRSTTASGLITVLAGALVLGFVVGRFSAGGPGARAATSNAAVQADEVNATATRAAELLELDRLRAQVAGSPVAIVCSPAATSTPEPSPTPTPTATVVPPAAMGQAVTYGDAWTVVVNAVALLPTFGDLTSQSGAFARVSLTITNTTGDRLRFPYDDLVLLDEDGRTYFPSRDSKLVPEVGWFNWLEPSLPTEGVVIFDVATDATGPFILESTADPAFRVQVVLEDRG